MAISTGIKIRMKLVTKVNIPGILVLKDQLFYRMTLCTIFYREGLF